MLIVQMYENAATRLQRSTTGASNLQEPLKGLDGTKLGGR